MSSITFFGECMIELRHSGEHSFSQSYAGDIYNAAVYLKRCFPEIKTGISTCIGNDKYSQLMLNAFVAEGLNTEPVLTHVSKQPGLYIVDTDAKGERSFSYWRNDSAAKVALAQFTNEYVTQLQQNKMFFFSGISLAIIDDSLREKFWDTLTLLKNAGVIIVFDPNYRKALWPSFTDTMIQYEMALHFADIVLPGIEDMQSLYAVNTVEETILSLERFDIQELVIKDGPNAVHVLHNNELKTVSIAPITHVVDTTSAGDSFNGAYLGARLQGENITAAVNIAASVAGTVIQHPGAIIPQSAMPNIQNIATK